MLWPLARRVRAVEGASPGHGAVALPKATVAALETSPFVYVSPLRADGSESTCHAEVWFAWLDGAVVVISAATSWKARAIAAGLDRARLWVGDRGRWRGLLGHNEEFRKAPSFDARAMLVRGDTELLDRLLSRYDAKYPGEIANWRDRMRQGYAQGSRVLIRYAPSAAGSART